MTNNAAFQHIYIHWPFCQKRCSYCDFVALAQHEDFFEPYHRALCKEIDLVLKNVATDTKIETIFLGGGTPSLCPPQMLEAIFEKLHKNFNLNSAQEITIEANPTDINREKLKNWKELGINRLSLGVQILEDQILKKLNRQQTSSDVLKAIELAPEFFENISIDLIFGLPEISQAIWQSTIQQAVKWPIKHISVYFLTVYEKTPLYFKIKKGDIKLADDEKLVPLYEQTINFLEENTFLQYEISNFAKHGYESAHNQAYWDRKAYYGFGLGASSFTGKDSSVQKRFTNQSNIEAYIRSIISDNIMPVYTSESLNQQQILLETLMLSLRQRKGIDLHTVLYLLMGTRRVIFTRNVELLKKESLLEQNGDRIRLSFKGMIIENEVVLKLLEGLF